MNLRQFFLILRLRWLLVLAVTLLVGAIGTGITLNMPKVFTSETSLLLDVKSDPLVATFMPAIATPAFLATQSHIIRSDGVAQAVIKRLGLAQSPEAVARWKSATRGQIPLESFYANMMQNGLKVTPVSGTNVLSIAFTATEPDFAATVANAYAQSYIDFSVDLRVEPARQYAIWFDLRRKELRVSLESAQKKLTDAQRDTGIVSSDVRVDEEITKLNTLQTQLATALAERTELTARAKNSGRDTSPDVQGSGMVQNLKAQLATAETRLAESRNKYGENHPEYQQLISQTGTLREQLAQEMRRVSGTSSVAVTQIDQKIGDLRSQTEAQKAHVFSLRLSKDNIDILAKDVESTQRAYDAVMMRRSQLNLESQSEQSGARVLSVALRPLAPSHPKVPKNIMMSVLGGLVAGIFLALGIELLDRRIRSVSDLKVLEDLPVLVVLSPNALSGGSLSLPLIASAKRMLSLR